MRRTTLFSLLLLALVHGPVGAAERYAIDAEHSNLRFSVPYDFMILGQLRGEFREFRGEVLYDRETPSESAVVVEIVTASVDTRFEARDIGLKGDGYLAVETYPVALFEGDDFERVGNHWILAGQLTMRGQSHEVEVVFELLDLGATLVANGSSAISRSAFGVDGPDLAGDVVIGDEVTLVLHLVLRRSADGDAG